GFPPGRYRSFVEPNWPNAAALPLIWLWNVASTGNPRSATFAAGVSDAESGRVPQRRIASCQVRRVAGTPVEIPLTRASSKAYAFAVCGLTKEFSRIAIGAVSRPSIVDTVRLAAS